MTTYVGTLGDDSHSGTEDIMYGLDGADTLTGNALGNGQTLYGGGRNDSLSGGTSPPQA